LEKSGGAVSNDSSWGEHDDIVVEDTAVGYRSNGGVNAVSDIQIVRLASTNATQLMSVKSMVCYKRSGIWLPSPQRQRVLDYRAVQGMVGTTEMYSRNVGKIGESGLLRSQPAKRGDKTTDGTMLGKFELHTPTSLAFGIVEYLFSLIPDQSFKYNVLEVTVLEKGGAQLSGYERAFFPVHRVQIWMDKHCAMTKRKKHLLSTLRGQTADDQMVEHHIDIYRN
jgi:hypothetical protein